MTKHRDAFGKGRSPTGHRIVVERVAEVAGVEPAYQSPQPSETLPLALPEPAPGRQLVVPSSAELQAALAHANTLEELVNFDKMIAVLKAAGEQFRAAIDEAIRIASFDLVTRRKIGTVLLQVNRRGGDRSKGHDASLLDKLLRELGKDKAKRCRAIARIAEEHFAAYLELMTVQQEVPTEAGVLRSARNAARASGKMPAGPRKAKKRKAESTAPALTPALLDVIQRALGHIDVCIGDAAVRCGTRLKASTAKNKQIRGKVFVSECLDPGECLVKLVKLRQEGGLEEALVVLPPQTGAAWFKELAQGEWHCCFPTGGGALVTYLGPKTRGFVVTFSHVGTVMFGCAGTEPAP